MAQARPNPLLAAHTMARRPRMPRSIAVLPIVARSAAISSSTARASGMVIGRRARSDARSSTADQDACRRERSLHAPHQKLDDLRSGTIWRSASCLTRRAPGARRRAGRSAPAKRSAGASAGRGAAPPSRRPGARRSAASCRPRSAIRFQRWNSCSSWADVIGIVDTQAAADGQSAATDRPGPIAPLPRRNDGARPLRPDSRQMRLAACRWPDQQAGRGRPVGPGENRVQRRPVGRRRHEVGEAIAVGMRQIERQLARPVDTPDRSCRSRGITGSGHCGRRAPATRCGLAART